MGFIELKKEESSGYYYDGLLVSDKRITISKPLIERMGRPDSATVFYDKEIQAVALKIGGENARKLIGSAKLQMTARVSEEMPKGRYLFREEKDDLFICTRV